MAFGYLEIMERHMGHLQFNRTLAKDLVNYANGFINKNEDHINFFGSNLTGVYSIYFTSLDKNELFIEVLNNIDDVTIRKEIRSLEDVGDSWMVVSEPVTACLMYAINRFQKSQLTGKALEDACLACGRIIHFKFLSSLINHYFPYNVNESLALAAFRALSRKYTLKQEGTWLKVIDRRVNDLLYNQDTWKKQLAEFGPDDELVKMFSDMQGRMRSMINNLASVTYRLHEEGVGIDPDNVQIKTDDGLIILDVTRLYNTYENYILTVLPEKRALIKPELVTLIDSAITTMPAPPLYDVLNSVSERALDGDKKVISFVKDVLTYVFEYLQENQQSDNGLNDLSLLIEKLKALITASKTSNHAVLKLRKDADAIIKKGTKIRNSSSLSGLRTGLILYIVIRTFTKNYYD